MDALYNNGAEGTGTSLGNNQKVDPNSENGRMVQPYEGGQVMPSDENQRSQGQVPILVGTAENVHHGNIYKKKTKNIYYNYNNTHAEGVFPLPIAAGRSNLIDPPEVTHEVVEPRFSEMQDVRHGTTNPNSLLKERLQLLYKQVVVPCVHWLPEGADLLFKDYYVELQQTDSTKKHVTIPIKLQELFEEVEGIQPKRILVEGQPGFGKTTFALKLMFDWAMSEQYLQQFEAAFLISLRNLSKGQSLEEELNSFDLSKIELQEKEKVLLVMDGFDEVNEESRADVIQALHGVKFNAMTVVITCRSGVFPLNRNELEGLLPATFQHQKSEFYQRKVTIQGISEEKRIEFIQKFCPSQIAGEIISSFKKLPEKVVNMLKSPLLLFFISYHRVNFEGATTLADLYKLLINGIAKTNLIRNGEKISSQFNLFKIEQRDSKVKVYQKKLKEFGEFCLNQLLEKKYSFEINEKMNGIYNLGLLSKHKAFHFLSGQSHYECFHLSIMEFCAAYYLWRKYKENWFRHKNPKIDQLVDLIEESYGTSMVCQFLSELMGKDSIFLFRQLNLKLEDEFVQIQFWQMVSRLKESEKKIKSIIDLIPTFVHSITDSSLDGFYLSEFHANIIKRLAKERKFSLWCSNDVPMNLPLDVVFEYVRFNVNTLIGLESIGYFANLTAIQCRTLIFEYCVPAEEEIEDPGLAEEYFEFFSNVSALDKKTLKIIDGYSVCSFIKSVTEGVLNEVHFHEIHCYLKEDIIDVIGMLLEEKRVCKLSVVIIENSDDCTEINLQKVMGFVSNCQSLDKLYIRNSVEKSIDLDLHQLAKREWKALEFYGCVLFCSQSVSISLCSDCMEMRDCLELSDNEVDKMFGKERLYYNDDAHVKCICNERAMCLLQLGGDC